MHHLVEIVQFLSCLHLMGSNASTLCSRDDFLHLWGNALLGCLAVQGVVDFLPKRREISLTAEVLVAKHLL